jgi:uncharacterized sulfatase
MYTSTNNPERRFKKRDLVKTMSLVVIGLLLSPIIVYGQTAPLMDSLWYQDPLLIAEPPPSGTPTDTIVPGWWWRDTSNQNAIVDFYDEIYLQIPHVETVTTGVYCVKGVGVSNVVALVGSDEWVLIDSTDSPQRMQLALLLLRPYIGTRRLAAIIFTGETSDHYAGSYVVAPLYSVPVYASNDFFTAMAEKSQIASLQFTRILQTEGSMLPSGPDDRLGTSMTVGKFPFQYPSIFVSTTTTVSLAGFDITLIPVDAPSQAGLMVWLPDQEILMVGDAIEPNFPDISPLNGPAVVPEEWVNTLDTILSLSPLEIVPHHGPVITSEEEATRITMIFRDAIQYIHDKTIYYMNWGYTPEEIASMITLPSPLSEEQYLQDYMSDMSMAVKGIYQLHAGWFNGEPIELASTLTQGVQAQLMVELAGGVENMMQIALDAELNANDQASAEKALLYSWALYETAPANKTAQIYGQSLKKAAYMQASQETRNYYLSVAARVMSSVMDTEAPTVEITSPMDGGVYSSDELPELCYVVSDDLYPDPVVEVDGWSTELGTHTVTVTATDAFDKVTPASVTYTIVESGSDLTPPEITITSPEDGASYLAGNVPELSYTVTDNLDPDPVVEATGWSDEAGAHTVTVTATDASGNSASASVTYTVWQVTGPSSPLSGNSNTYKAGRTIPVKFQIVDGENLLLTATGSVSIGSASAAFRWDAVAQQYVANVKIGSASTDVPVIIEITGLGSYTLCTITIR